MSKQTAIIFTQIIERPARNLLLRRSKSSSDYFEYCGEFGCDREGNSVPWRILTQVREALYEPVGLWLPDNMRPEGTGIYAQGVEVGANFAGKVPEGFEIIESEPCRMLVFQGETYDDEDCCGAIDALWERIQKFTPEVYGYAYADELAPRMQLEPMGWRGYIEMRPIRKIVKPIDEKAP